MKDTRPAPYMDKFARTVSIKILLLLAALPVRGQVSQAYSYQPPNQRIVYDKIIRQKSESEPVGTKTAHAIKDFTAVMLPRKALKDVAQSMIDKMAFMMDIIGPSFDRPVREMMNDFMDSTPSDIMHGLLDPVMSSPSSNNTLEELDRQLAELIHSEIGNVPLDSADEIFGGRTISSLITYVSEVLPKITAAQFALQFMVQFDPVMEAMTKKTVREMIEPVMHAMANIPDATLSEAVHMLAKPIIRSGQVKLSTMDEATAEFIEQLKNSSTGPQRFGGDQDLNRNINTIDSGVRVVDTDQLQEQTDISRFNDESQNVESHSNLHVPDIVNQGPSLLQGGADQHQHASFSTFDHQDPGSGNSEHGFNVPDHPAFSGQTGYQPVLDVDGSKNQVSPKFPSSQSEFGPLIHRLNPSNRLFGRVFDQLLTQAARETNSISHSQEEVHPIKGSHRVTTVSQDVTDEDREQFAGSSQSAIGPGGSGSSFA